MLRYFRINDPYRLLGALVIGILLFLPTFLDTPQVTYPELKSFLVGEKIHEGNGIFTEIVDSTGPVAAWFYGLFDIVFGRSLTGRHIVTFLIIFLQGAFFALACINRKIFPENTYLPALLFGSLFAFSFDTLALTSEVIGSGFLLLALNNLFREIDFRGQRDDTVVGVGLFISCASLCSFAFAVFLIAAIFIQVIYSRRDLRTLLLLVVGFALPHVLLILFYFLIGHTSRLVNFYYLPNLGFTSDHYVSAKTLLTLGGVPLFFLLISFVILNRGTRLTKYQSQVFQSMFIWMLVCVLYVFYAKGLRPQTLVVFVPVLSFFLTHFFLSLQRKMFAELSLWLLLLGTATVSNVVKKDKANYEGLIVKQNNQWTIKDKRLLVLSNDVSYFVNNSAATPFLTWQLAKPYLTNADYFENVVWFNEAVKHDPPEYIIDPEQHIKAFMDRIPELKERYSMEGAGVYVRKK